MAISVCTSDVNTVYGSGSKKPDNLILGHEAVARVVKAGESVRDFKEGDIVVVPSMTPNFHDKDIQDGNLLHAGANFSANINFMTLKCTLEAEAEKMNEIIEKAMEIIKVEQPDVEVKRA